MLILDVQSLHQGQLLQQRLGYSLARWWKAAKSQIEASAKTFESLQKKGFANNRVLLMDFLYKQRSAQNEYFQSTKALDKLQKFEELRLLYDITIICGKNIISK